MYQSLLILSFLPLTVLLNETTENINQISVETTASENSESNLTLLIDNFKKNWPVKQWIRTGFFSEEYLTDINVHWLKYPSPEPIYFYLFGFMYLIILSVGAIGNLLVIFLFFRWVRNIYFELHLKYKHLIPELIFSVIWDNIPLGFEAITNFVKWILLKMTLSIHPVIWELISTIKGLKSRA